MHKKQFGDRLRFLRKLGGLTLGRLAECAEISEIHLGNIERGSASPSLEMVHRLAVALGTDPLNFFLPPSGNLDSLEESPLGESVTEWRKYITQFGLWGYDPALEIIHLSQTMLNVLGRTESGVSVTIDAFLEMIHPEDRKMMRAGWNRFLSGDHDHVDVFRFYRKDGSLRLGMIQGNADFDANGQVVRYHGIVLDITEQWQFEHALLANQQSIEFLIQERTKNLLSAKKNAENESRLRARAEKKARKNEQMYRILFENMQDGFIRHDNNGVIVMANKAAAHILGYPSSVALQGVHVRELYATLSDKEVYLPELKKLGRLSSIEIPFRRKDGSHGWALCNLQLFKDEDNDIQGTEVFFRDITAKKKSEEKLQQTLALLDATASMAKVGGWTYRFGAPRMTWSDQTCVIHDLPKGHCPTLQEALGYVHPDDQKTIGQALRHAVDHDEPWDIELRLITAKGRRIWLRTLGSPEKNDDGVLLRGVVQDITEWKVIHETLAFNERRFKTLLFNSPVGVALANTQGIVTDCNEAFATMLGYTRDELSGAHFATLTHNEDIVDELSHIERLMRSNSGSYRIEKRFFHKNGKTIWVDMTSCFSRGNSADDSFAVAFIIDISLHRNTDPASERI